MCEFEWKSTEILPELYPDGEDFESCGTKFSNNRRSASVLVYTPKLPLKFAVARLVTYTAQDIEDGGFVSSPYEESYWETELDAVDEYQIKAWAYIPDVEERNA